MEHRDSIITEKSKDSFCVLPWIHLATHPIGTVTPCCITDMTDSASTATISEEDERHLFLSKNTLDEIANSHKFKEVRRQMMNGQKPAICNKCFKYEDNNVYSKRLESNLKFKQHVNDCFKNTKPDGTLIDVNYKYIELRLGTVCNLKCTTCNPFSSNRWNQDIKAYKGTEFEKDYFKNDIKVEWFRDYRFYDELYTKCDGLQEVWINGGEPTLIKEHGYFLQKFIDDGSSTKIDLHYSLNCTQFPDHFIDIWKKFKKVRIHLSIDDLENRNFYVRFPSDWNQIMESFDKILKYRDIFDLEVCQTVSSLNVFNMDNFKKFTKDHNLIIAHNFVHYPDHLHVSLIPDEMKKQILNNISHLDPHEIERLKTELNRNVTNEDTEKFYRFIRINDKVRKLDITEYLPEWKPYIK
mgnify:CR=1 FL=1